MWVGSPYKHAVTPRGPLPVAEAQVLCAPPLPPGLAGTPPCLGQPAGRNRWLTATSSHSAEEEIEMQGHEVAGPGSRSQVCLTRTLVPDRDVELRTMVIPWSRWKLKVTVIIMEGSAPGCRAG